MKFRLTRFFVSAVFAVTLLPSAHAQHASVASGQWRASPVTLSTLLQDGYKIVAVVNDARSAAQAANIIFLQRDQSAFKCIDPQLQLDAKTKAPAAAPACLELVQPSAAPDEPK